MAFDHQRFQAMVLPKSDKTIHFSKYIEDQRHIDDTVNLINDGNETIEKVLPQCDTLAESIQLDRNNKSLIDTPNVQVEKVSDLYANGHVIDVDNTQVDHHDSQVEDKLSSLEDVVEKVVELYIADNTIEDEINIPKDLFEQSKNVDHSSVLKNDETPTNFERIPTDSETKPSIIDIDELIEEKVEESLSPSQSTSSRATRWEALADIAAELPPQLAVDPLTGQIYALSK
ncbi:uncharacterized protein LOC106135000 isoform X2 [Amyelois transitella]|uniref:uncharacterized protein LOC106135000 isoform X2 n=1 Tax=Amyelois transitella TaxID=680683 RepID=UPI00067C83A2|nr:uncharacterized protein LOC106135000 isoform X2 [Amyelois transitella]